jgi:S-methylmethionine-dependent homocysteine/selenocysteine methylase
MSQILAMQRGIDMNFAVAFNTFSKILMEGAIGERLKREYNIRFDDKVAMAGLIYQSTARQALQNIYEEYVTIAAKYQLPFIATTPTRRANRERVRESAFTEQIIKDNIVFLQEIKNRTKVAMFVGGLMGCKGDAYKGTEVLSIEQAISFHSWQANLFRAAGAEFLFAGIMPALSEAIGMAIAMEEARLPYIISFMIREDGKLIDGTTINKAIWEIDNATIQKTICYMTNCVHPTVLGKALSYQFNTTRLVKERLRGIQANTSPLPPEQLDNCCDLQSSDSKSLAADMMELSKYCRLKIFGGCCGTDMTHVEEIAKKLYDI